MRRFAGESDELAEFAEFALRNQQRLPLIRALEKTDLISRLPESVIGPLQRYSRSQAARHDVLCGILLEIDTMLRSHRIDYILLKGPAYAEHLYGDRDGRHFDDIDILVRLDDHNRAESLLSEIGFKPDEAPRPWDALLRNFEHAITLSRDGYKVDLHRQLRRRPAYRINDAEIWSTRQERKVAGVEVGLLSPEYELAATALEIAHDLERNACTVKTALDLYLLIRRAEGQIEWSRFFADRELENIEPLVTNVFALVLGLTGSWDEFPTLSAYLRPMEKGFPIKDPVSVAALFDREVDDGRNRVWFRKVYPGNSIIYWSWLGMAFLCSRRPPRFLSAMQQQAAKRQ
ncbi:MAG: nucleotidyltransferase family protein [Alphaproteobacteria bacterium]|nr:nucleotidyltransferase family protein [Alphaproteobacteria bacterium]